jgi:hypothetical protein
MPKLVAHGVLSLIATPYMCTTSENAGDSKYLAFRTSLIFAGRACCRVQMLHLGGYHSLEGDERLWQEIAIQLELPAWPSPEVPDPIRVMQQVRQQRTFTQLDVSALWCSGALFQQHPTQSATSDPGVMVAVMDMSC